jgi:hypothetical protein
VACWRGASARSNKRKRRKESEEDNVKGDEKGQTVIEKRKELKRFD